MSEGRNSCGGQNPEQLKSRTNRQSRNPSGYEEIAVRSLDLRDALRVQAGKQPLRSPLQAAAPGAGQPSLLRTIYEPPPSAVRLVQQTSSVRPASAAPVRSDRSWRTSETRLAAGNPHASPLQQNNSPGTSPASAASGRSDVPDIFLRVGDASPLTAGMIGTPGQRTPSRPNSAQSIKARLIIPGFQYSGQSPTQRGQSTMEMRSSGEKPVEEPPKKARASGNQSSIDWQQAGLESGPLKIGERVTYTGFIEYQRTASTVGEECDVLEQRMSVQDKWAPDSVCSAGVQLSPGSMSAASTTTGTAAHRRPWQHGGVHSPSSGASSPTRPQSAQSFRTGVSGGSASPTRAVYISSRNYGDPSRPRSPVGGVEKLGGRAWGQGYTGHVPQERGAYGVTKGRAVAHVSNTVPPLSPMVQLAWSPQGTQRTLSVPMGLEIQGKSCTGAQRPAQTDPIFESSQYAQGSKVDLDYFYDAAAATSPLIVASPTKQALVMQKTRSRNVVNGDKYYFAGKQHYDTTHRDTFVANANEDDDDSWMLALDGEGNGYSPMSPAPYSPMGPALSSCMSSSRPSSASSYFARAQNKEQVRQQQKQNMRLHDYKAAAAVVGRKKLDELAASVRDKLQQRIGHQVSGSFQRMWRHVDKDSCGKVSVAQLYEVCWQLGVQTTKTEARALMSRYDVDLDGYITFHEFLQNVIHEVLGVDQDSNALRRVQAR